MRPDFVCSAAGFDGGYRADERHRVALAQGGERQGARGIAGDDHEVGTRLVDELADDRDDALDELRLVPGAIGKGGVVGGVDERRSGLGLAYRRGDGEAAHAAVEEKDARRCHSSVVPFRFKCARVSDATMPLSERTSCSVSSARAKRLRMLRIIPGFFSAVLKKPAWSNSVSIW